MLEWTEGTIATLGLLFFAGSFNYLPDAGISAIRYSVLFIVICFLLIRASKAIYLLVKAFPFTLAALLILLSFAWSIAPFESLYHGRELLQATLFGLYLATRFKILELVNILCLSLAIGMAISTVVALLFPAIGTHVDAIHPGAWRGLYFHKNVLGSLIALSFFSAYLLLVRRGGKIFPLFVICASSALIILSVSRTSLVCAIILLVFINVYRNFKFRGKMRILLISILALLFLPLSVFSLGYWDELLTSLGRDPTLTGRTYIWSFALEKLQERPILGFGYRAFWFPEGSFAQEFAAFQGWPSPSAHNALVDLLLDAGLLGVMFFVLSFLQTLYGSFKQSTQEDPINLWPLSFLLFLILNNVTESYLLGGINWVLYTYLSYYLVKGGRNSKSLAGLTDKT